MERYAEVIYKYCRHWYSQRVLEFISKNTEEQLHTHTYSHINTHTQVSLYTAVQSFFFPSLNSRKHFPSITFKARITQEFLLVLPLCGADSQTAGLRWKCHACDQALGVWGYLLLAGFPACLLHCHPKWQSASYNVKPGWLSYLIRIFQVPPCLPTPLFRMSISTARPSWGGGKQRKGMPAKFLFS